MHIKSPSTTIRAQGSELIGVDRRTSKNVGFEILGLIGLWVLPFEKACFSYLLVNNSNLSTKLPDVWQQFDTEILGGVSFEEGKQQANLLNWNKKVFLCTKLCKKESTRRRPLVSVDFNFIDLISGLTCKEHAPAWGRDQTWFGLWTGAYLVHLCNWFLQTNHSTCMLTLSTL